MIKILETEIDLDKIHQEFTFLENTLGWDDHNKLYLQKSTHALIDGFKTSSLEMEKSFNDLIIPHEFELARIVKQYNLFRTRFIKLNPENCYFLHKDRSKRVHLPLITNDNCFFLINEKVHRLPANGSLYLVDTDKYTHTFINGNRDFTRIHLVGGQDLC